jgi:hypothetical protein
MITGSNCSIIRTSRGTYYRFHLLCHPFARNQPPVLRVAEGACNSHSSSLLSDSFRVSLSLARNPVLLLLLLSPYSLLSVTQELHGLRPSPNHSFSRNSHTSRVLRVAIPSSLLSSLISLTQPQGPHHGHPFSPRPPFLRGRLCPHCFPPLPNHPPPLTAKVRRCDHWADSLRRCKGTPTARLRARHRRLPRRKTRTRKKRRKILSTRRRGRSLRSII